MSQSSRTCAANAMRRPSGDGTGDDNGVAERSITVGCGSPPRATARMVFSVGVRTNHVTNPPLVETAGDAPTKLRFSPEFVFLISTLPPTTYTTYPPAV